MSQENQRWVMKHNTIMEAATDVFFAQGFAAASMDAIAKKAGISKMTIYKHFENKHRLFNEMMGYYCQTLYQEPSPIICFSLDLTPEKILTEFSKKLIELLLRPKSIALIRVVIAEVDKFPEIAESVWENGRMPLQDIFSNYLANEVEHQRMDIPNLTIATKQFFGMIKENFVWPALTGLKSPNSKQTSEIIQSTVRVFLARYLCNPLHSSKTTLC